MCDSFLNVYYGEKLNPILKVFIWLEYAIDDLKIFSHSVLEIKVSPDHVQYERGRRSYVRK
jgi:hypothetical protein